MCETDTATLDTSLQHVQDWHCHTWHCPAAHKRLTPLHLTLPCSTYETDTATRDTALQHLQDWHCYTWHCPTARTQMAVPGNRLWTINKTSIWLYCRMVFPSYHPDELSLTIVSHRASESWSIISDKDLVGSVAFACDSGQTHCWWLANLLDCWVFRKTNCSVMSLIRKHLILVVLLPLMLNVNCISGIIYSQSWI